MDTIKTWHDFIADRNPATLEALLSEEAVFHSPALHPPQPGRAVTLKYLLAAVKVLGNEHFRYVGEWRAEGSAVLEFESVIEGVEINGVDIIHWNSEGLIVSFKVMVRPFKALNKVIELMRAELTRS